MSWWLWYIIGALLVVGEVVVPGALIFLFVGLGAFGVGTLAYFDAVTSPTWQWGLFSGFMILAFLLLIGRLKKMTHARPGVNEFAGARATSVGVIPAGGDGSVELRGTVWGARNVGGGTIPAATPCYVEGVDGIRLKVRPLDK